MVSILALLLIQPTVPAPAQPGQVVKLEGVPFTQVTIKDRFWTPRQEANRKATVEKCLEQLEKVGNFSNYQLVKDGKRSGYKGYIFTDSDVYKVLEGIAYTLATHPDPKLDSRMDEIIALIASTQMENGYLNSWYQVNAPDKTFTNLRDNHELYCTGHMIEAAVAHYQATGKRNFLDVALKSAELLYKNFGPNGKPGYPGHPELELALVKLWKATGDRKWFELSRRMVENRGTGYFAAEHSTPRDRYDGTYWLDDLPICNHEEIKGHAVRAAYLLAGAADIARETDDAAMIKMLGRVWSNATEKRIFVTGGIGPSASNEGFTVDYDLPNMTAYQETCASIAMALWGHRMALLYGDAKYMDAVEKALYNGLLSGISLDGKKFFYVNPLASMGSHHRQDWFGCACCPPNVLRTIAWIGGYAYASSADSLYVNLYVGGSARAKLGEKEIVFDAKTDYPWDGKAEYRMKSAGSWAMRMRIPGWCRGAAVSVNGQRVADPTVEKGYFVVRREWKTGDVLTVDMPMPVDQIEAHPWVKDDLGRAAVQRGPLVYCVEQTDNETPVDEMILPRGSEFKAEYRRELLGGIVAIRAEGQKATATEWDRQLYQPIARPQKATLTLIPYGFWDNRKPGRMEVWLPTVPPPAKVVGPEGKATVSVSFKSSNAQPWGINDGVEPASSGEQPKALCHFWPHKGGEEWVQYTWSKPMQVKGVKVFWFDDTGRGECRLPASWKLQALVNGEFRDVPLKEAPIALDKWSSVEFEPVATTALRLVVRLKDGWASGIHEWKIVAGEVD